MSNWVKLGFPLGLGMSDGVFVTEHSVALVLVIGRGCHG